MREWEGEIVSTGQRVDGGLKLGSSTVFYLSRGIQKNVRRDRELTTINSTSTGSEPGWRGGEIWEPRECSEGEFEIWCWTFMSNIIKSILRRAASYWKKILWQRICQKVFYFNKSETPFSSPKSQFICKLIASLLLCPLLTTLRLLSPSTRQSVRCVPFPSDQ